METARRRFGLRGGQQDMADTRPGVRKLVVLSFPKGELLDALKHLEIARTHPGDAPLVFKPKTILRITQLLVGGPVDFGVLRLCHFLVAVAATDEDLGSFPMMFRGSPRDARAIFTREALQPVMGARVSASKAGIELSYPDGDFTIDYSAVPELLALAEVLANGLGYHTIGGLIDAVHESPVSMQRVKDIAQSVMPEFRTWIERNMAVSRQSRQKFKKMIDFLERFRGADFSTDDIDDEAVLELWKEHAGSDDDFKLFGTALDSLLFLIRQAHEGQRRLEEDRMGGLDFAYEDGRYTIDPGYDPEADDFDTFASWFVFINGSDDDDADFVAPLKDAGNILFAKQWAWLDPYWPAPDGPHLMRSRLRADAFGALQRRIVQALRRNASRTEICGLIGVAPEETYDVIAGRAEKAHSDIWTAAHAILHVLIASEHENALHLLYTLRQRDVDLRSFVQTLVLEDLVDTEALARDGLDALADAFFEALRRGDITPDDVATVVRQSEGFWRKLKDRAGFKPAEIEDPVRVESFAEVTGDLTKAVTRIGSVRTMIDRACPAGERENLFKSDYQSFAGLFLRLYVDGIE